MAEWSKALDHPRKDGFAGSNPNFVLLFFKYCLGYFYKFLFFSLFSIFLHDKIIPSNYIVFLGGVKYPHGEPILSLAQCRVAH